MPAGIPAYWIVDPGAAEVTALRLEDSGAYQTHAEGAMAVLEWPVTATIDVATLSEPQS